VGGRQAPRAKATKLVRRFRRRHGATADPTLEELLERKLEGPIKRFRKDAEALALTIGPPYRQALARVSDSEGRFWLVMAGLSRAYQIDDTRRQGGLARGSADNRAIERAGSAWTALYRPGLTRNIGARLEAFLTAPPERKLRRFRLLSPGVRTELAFRDGGKSPEQYEASLPPQDASKQRRRTAINGLEATFLQACARRRISKSIGFCLMELAYRMVDPEGRRAFDRPAVFRRVARCEPANELSLIWLGPPVLLPGPSHNRQ
jgi:hypothetical protein